MTIPGSQSTANLDGLSRTQKTVFCQLLLLNFFKARNKHFAILK